MSSGLAFQRSFAPVKARQTGSSTKPHQTLTILVNGWHGAILQSLALTDVAESKCLFGPANESKVR